MFDFLKYLDKKLVSIISQLENDIIYKNPNIYVTFQTYCETLFKLVESKETGRKSDRKALGGFLNNSKYIKILEEDLFIDVNELNNINNKANSTKHDANYSFDEEDIKKKIELIFNFSRSVLKCYFSNIKVNPNFDSQYFERILKTKQDLDLINKQVNEELNLYKEALKDAEKEKELLKEMINNSSYDDEKFADKLDKLNKSENELKEKDNEIFILKDKLSLMEQMINEVNDSEKEELNAKIDELIKEKESLNNEVNRLRSLEVSDPIIFNNFNKVLLEEKESEINELKSLIDNQEIIKDLKMYKLYRKSALQLGFSSSYCECDEKFIVTGLGVNCLSTSKYKSFYAVLNNILQRGRVVSKSSYLDSQDLTDEELFEVFRLEVTILSLIRNNKLHDNEWKINYIDGEKRLLEIAINDIFYWIRLITDISKVSYIEPEVKITTTEYDSNVVNIKYDNKFSYEYNIYNIIDVLDVDDNDEFFSIWIDEFINYDVTLDKLHNLELLLKELFGFDKFNDGQFEILMHALNGNNTIGILPTGGGKSLIYQLASLLEPKVTLVVAPINSLIKNQIDSLRDKFGITRCLNLTSSNKDKNKDLELLRKGHSLFVFLSPERFQTVNFRQILLKLANKKYVERIVLDEVHCLSEWGHDFRISYLMLADTLTKFCGESVKFLGLTATASASVVNDLIIELNMKKEDVIFLKHLRRNNLTFSFKTYSSVDVMYQSIINKINSVSPKLNGDKTNSMILFCSTVGGKSPTSINNIQTTLNDEFDDLIDVYYGDRENKDDVQDSFINNNKSILISTKAFGMGIDKPNIRCTIHCGIPSSFESFYQEAGRAGRDKLNSDCELYTYNNNDLSMKKYITDFFKENTDVDSMKKLVMYHLNNSNLGSQLYFFTRDLTDFKKEASDVLIFYKYLVARENDKNDILVVTTDQREQYLYVLHKLGIVSDWEKDYINNTLHIHLTSYFDDINYIKNEAIMYVSQYKKNDDVINKIKSIYSTDELDLLVQFIREWYFNNFILARKNQLYNMYSKIEKYANQDCSDIIQEEIDSYFDISNILYTTEEGYSLKFEDDTFNNIVRYVSELDDYAIEKRIIEMERVLESITTPNISLYTSLLLLRKGNFDSVNGKYRFENIYNQASVQDKTCILICLAEDLYYVLSDERKVMLLDMLYEIDYNLFRRVFLEHVQEDELNKKYWFRYFNERISDILNGGNRYE